MSSFSIAKFFFSVCRSIFSSNLILLRLNNYRSSVYPLNITTMENNMTISIAPSYIWQAENTSVIGSKVGNSPAFRSALTEVIALTIPQRIVLRGNISSCCHQRLSRLPTLLVVLVAKPLTFRTMLCVNTRECRYIPQTRKRTARCVLCRYRLYQVGLSPLTPHE